MIASRASRLERPVAGPSDLRTVDPMPGRVFFAYSTPPLSAIVTPTLRPPLNTRFLCFCSFSGEPTSHSLAQSAPAPSLPIAQKPRTSRLNPYPRRLELGRNPSYLICPPTFGKNRLFAGSGFRTDAFGNDGLDSIRRSNPVRLCIRLGSLRTRWMFVSEETDGQFCFRHRPRIGIPSTRPRSQDIIHFIRVRLVPISSRMSRRYSQGSGSKIRCLTPSLCIHLIHLLANSPFHSPCSSAHRPAA